MKNNRLILIIILIFAIFFGLMLRDVDLPGMKPVKNIDREAKIGVISDTHIPTRAESIPDEVLQRFRDEEVDLIIHGGDMVSLQVKEELENIAPLVAASGNMDHEEVRSKYQKAVLIEAGDRRIGVIHNAVSPVSGKMEMLARENNLDVLIFGHTHRSKLSEKNGTHYFNPGSPTQPIMSQASFGLVDLHEEEIEPKLIKIEK